MLRQRSDKLLMLVLVVRKKRMAETNGEERRSRIKDRCELSIRIYCEFG